MAPSAAASAWRPRGGRGADPASCIPGCCVSETRPPSAVPPLASAALRLGRRSDAPGHRLAVPCSWIRPGLVAGHRWPAGEGRGRAARPASQFTLIMKLAICAVQSVSRAHFFPRYAAGPGCQNQMFDNGNPSTTFAEEGPIGRYRPRGRRGAGQEPCNSTHTACRSVLAGVIRNRQIFTLAPCLSVAD